MAVAPAARLGRLVVGPALGALPSSGGFEGGMGAVPNALDWRQSGAFTKVKDQGSCRERTLLNLLFYLDIAELICFLRQSFAVCVVVVIYDFKI